MPAPQAISASGRPCGLGHRRGGSAPARSASRGPCRAARCPSPRRRRGRGPTGGGGRRACASQSIAGVEPGIVVGERVGDDMRRGVGDAREVARRARRASGTGSPRELVALDRAVAAAGRSTAMAQNSSSGTSSQRRSAQDLQAELGELHALGAGLEPVAPRAVLGDVAQEQLPLRLEAVVGAGSVRHLLPVARRSRWSAAGRGSRPASGC